MYLHLDDSLEPDRDSRDAREWGPRLRCFAPRGVMASFLRDVARDLPPFVLYGSGDFHHLTAAFLRNFSTPLTVVSFDNHPDWDMRPPAWACGGWMKRALELPHVRRAVVWGCGNFELNFPSRLFGHSRVEVHAWRERFPKRGGMTRDDWRPRFERFASALENVYVTVDLDCLRDEEIVTNWENGLFTADDVAWAIATLRSKAYVIGGDVCGAYSTPVYARATQRFAAEWDRPKRGQPDLASARAINAKSVQTIWAAMTSTRA